MGHDDETSVEEILASIKKVIARDDRERMQNMRRRRESAGMSESIPEPVDEEEAEEILDLGSAELIEDSISAPSLGSTESDADGDEEISLVTAKTRDAMRENLAALAMIAEPGAQPKIVRSGETSLEGLVRDLLRPMLSEWLDENLPGIVEEQVRAEIARIAGKRS
ncbi:DUF2497 domain-containing protein [Qipengyuania sp. JC766]|uniref:DUF2497 domain-containing protein n=1 Tax=Qipengyuania sp. JC766 TaxID=3232139 RepID=UPI003458D021